MRYKRIDIKLNDVGMEYVNKSKTVRRETLKLFDSKSDRRILGCL